MKIPVVFYHGKTFHLVTFGLFASVGAMAGYAIGFFFLATKGYNVHDVCWGIALILSLFNLVFAKLYSILAIGAREFFRNPIKYLNETSFYQQGGIIGLIFGTILINFILDIPFGVLGDLVSLGGITTLAIGRLGCLNYGCCTGIPTKGRFGWKYSDPEARICRDKPELMNVPLIPVQLISSLVDFLILIACLLVAAFYQGSGLIILVFIVCLNIKRIIIQPFRYRTGSNKIPYGWIALGLIITVAIITTLFFLFEKSVFKISETVIPFTIKEFSRIILSDISVMGSLLVVFILNFIAYGIHGQKLGIHFNLKDENNNHK